MSMMTTAEREKRHAVSAAERHRTSIHEAGHAIVGRALGFVVDEVTLHGGAGGGVCHAELPPHDTLDNIKRELSFVLAGRLAVALEGDEKWVGDWHHWRDGNDMIGSQLWTTIELEASRLSGLSGTGMRCCDYSRVAAVHLDGDELAAFGWLRRELPLAADEAVRILRDRWGEVLGLAARLRKSNTVDLGETERQKRWDASVEQAEIGLARMRARHAAGR